MTYQGESFPAKLNRVQLMSPAENLIGRLDSVRQTGPDRWRARCPAHSDKSPSLDIREANDHRLLLICRAGCATEDVLNSIGLTFSDLFPPRPENHRYQPIRKPFPRVPREVLATLYREIWILKIVGNLVRTESDGIVNFRQRDYECLYGAVDRIAKTLELAGMCGGSVNV